MPDHTHPEIDDRITAEIALLRTEIAGVSARVDILRQDMQVMRQDSRRGFTDMTQVLGQILARLPEQPEG